MNDIILELSAFLLSLFCFVYSITVRRRLYFPFPKGVLNKLRSRHTSFLIMLIAVMVSSATSVLGSIGHYFGYSAVVLELFHTLYYLFHNMLSVFFGLYILTMFGPVKDQGKVFFILFMLPLVLGEILILLNPINHLCFYVDESLVYHRGTALVALYAIAAVYIVLGYLYFAKFSGSMQKTDRRATLILITVAIAGVVIQAVWSVLVELFFESIAFMGFMALLEHDAESTGADMSERFRRSITIAIVLTFLSVIAMNAMLIFRLTSSQSDEIGMMRLESIKRDLEETVSNAEKNILQFEIGAEQLTDRNASMEELEAYIIYQSKGLRADPSFMKAYLAGSDWSLFPGVLLPEGYHANERIWFIGARENPGKVFITDPYVDAETEDICFTVSTLLSDGDTVAAIDINFSQAQDSISEISKDGSSDAMIITEDGVIAVYSDTSFVSKNANNALPEYSEIIRRVISSNEHAGFKASLNGSSHMIFSSETVNGWYLILSVDTGTLYKDNYRQMTTMVAVNLLMLVVVVVFYIVSSRNRNTYAKLLFEKEKLTNSLTNSLRENTSNIIRLSDWRLIEKSDDPSELVGRIKESGLRISDALNNYQSLSNVGEKHAEAERSFDAEKPVSFDVPSRKIRNLIIFVLSAALAVVLFLCVTSAVNWGNTRMQREADGYENRLNEWIAQQQSLLSMFTDLISAQPEILNDYEGAVKLLNDIAAKYPEITACYLANPYSEHTVIMNTGWVPGADERPETRPWYRNTELSPTGFNISSPYIDAQTGEYCVTLSRVVYGENNEFLGIFGIDFSLDKVMLVLGQSYSSTGYSFLVDSDHTIINHPNSHYQMSESNAVSIEDTEYAEAYNSDSVVMIRDYNGKLVSCISRMNSSGFTVMVAKRWWSIYGSVVLIIPVFLALFGFCIFFIILLINRLIRWQESANRRLVEAADEAVNAGKAKSQFLAQMSHEIRTPINAVLGMNDMIMNATGDSEILEYSTNIRTAGNTLLSLINSILDFSKIEDGKMEILNVNYNTLGLIDPLVKMFSERAVKKGLDLLLDIDSGIPSVMYGDDMRLRQVLSNLLSNAVKYTPKGSVTLSVKALSITDDECVLTFAVTDTGIGIKEEDVDKLFASFMRLDQERNRSIEGTGLGIAIVQRLLSMMDSKLEVNSVYGRGSTFSFRLKQKVIDRAPIGSYDAHHSAVMLAEKTRRTVRAPEADILVVDDNELNLKVAKGLLKRSGISADLAGSGAKCLEMASYKHYDIIFMDHMMPGMDGIQTLKVLKERNSIKDNTAVIALTANAIVGAREQYISAGFIDYLSKPIDFDELQQMLFNYLPKNKVEWESSAKPEKEESADEQDPIVKLASMGFNTEEGLRYAAGDRAFYLDLLKSFASEQEAKDRAIEDAAKLNDLHNYEILVHALKSGARMIGADKLSEMALDQENAAKNLDAEAVKNAYEDLITLDRKTAERIRSALAEEDEPDNADIPETSAEIDPQALKDVINEAISCLNSFEVERATELLKEHGDCSFKGKKLDVLFEEAAKALDDFETNKASEHLKSILRNI